ncbi:MAG: deaminase reductase [Melioribacteraceae bacterium]|nr:MAG: deaminase reductase [Melioribacteraceae bacterium]
MLVSVFIAISLDGFIARKDGDIDWLTGDDSEESEDHGFGDFFNSVDALLMGKNTFEKVLSFGQWPYGDKKVIVASNSLKNLPEIKNANLQLINGSPGEIFTKLEKQGYKKIYLDGGNLIQSFLRDGLVDELIISIIPVLIGDGIPLFGEVNQDIKLKLVDTKSCNNGIVQTFYKVSK